MHTREAVLPIRCYPHGSIALLCVIMLCGGCASNRPVPGPEPHPWHKPAATDEAGQTLGEQLGRLDARMQSAETDSMRIYQRQYDSLLALAAGPAADTSMMVGLPERQTGYAQEMITTGPPASNSSATPLSQSGNDSVGSAVSLDSGSPDSSRYFTSTPRRSLGETPEPETISDQESLSEDTYTSTARRQAGTTAQQPVTSKPVDARLFKGLRESEKRTIPGYRAASPARTKKASRTRTRATREAAKRQSARPAEVASSDAGSESSRPAPSLSQSGTARSQARVSEINIVEGIAAERAGKYSEAAKRLGTVEGGPKTPAARFSYALSLEKTGNLSKAASEYLALSSGGTSLGHKAYIGYCRVLSMQGQRGRARELVQKFIRQNPRSGQVGSARRLLQSL